MTGQAGADRPGRRAGGRAGSRLHSGLGAHGVGRSRRRGFVRLRSEANDLGGGQVVTFVELEGAVQRDPVIGQPIGTLIGVAVEDVMTGQRINAYRDPQVLLFYGSFTPQSP